MNKYCHPDERHWVDAFAAGTPFCGTKLLGNSIGNAFGAPKGVKETAFQKILWPKRAVYLYCMARVTALACVFCMISRLLSGTPFPARRCCRCCCRSPELPTTLSSAPYDAAILYAASREDLRSEKAKTKQNETNFDAHDAKKNETEFVSHLSPKKKPSP